MKLQKHNTVIYNDHVKAAGTFARENNVSIPIFYYSNWIFIIALPLIGVIWSLDILWHIHCIYSNIRPKWDRSFLSAQDEVNPKLVQFADSKYLKLYNHYTKDEAQLSLSFWKEMAMLALKTLRNNPQMSYGELCLRLWTGSEDQDINGLENQVYKLINNSILEDDCKQWMPFIRLMNLHIVGVDVDKPEIVVWRRSRITREQALKFEIGECYRPQMYVATSKSRSYVMKSSWPGNSSADGEVFWKILIPSDSWQHGNIEKISGYNEEDEVLILPYSPIVISGREKERVGYRDIIILSATLNPRSSDFQDTSFESIVM